MAKIKFEDGTIVNFNGTPTPEDVDYVARQLKIQSSVQEPQVEEKKDGLLKRVGKLITSNQRKFGETLGTAASVIDPKTRKMRQETLDSTNQMVDQYMDMARREEDTERKKKLLVAAKSLADTEDIDIFNNEEYQKTAKQVFGEGFAVAVDALAFGTYGKAASAIPSAIPKIATAGKMIGKGATVGGTLGAGYGVAGAMQEDASGEEILKSGVRGGVVGGVLGGAVGYGASKIVGKTSPKKLAELTSKRLSAKEKTLAYKQGRIKEATKLRSEKFLPSQKDLEMGRLAQDVGVKGKSYSKDISKVDGAIQIEATKLKDILSKKGAIYNQNTIKGQLNKIKTDATADLIPAEMRPYEKYISKFQKMVETSPNKKLDGLLDVRKQFDAWAKSNNPRIFENQTGGAYRALTAVRNTINDYINKQAGDDIVKASLKKQSMLFNMLENLAEKGAKGASKLQSSSIRKVGKRVFPWVAGGAAAGAGAGGIGKVMGGQQ